MAELSVWNEGLSNKGIYMNILTQNNIESIVKKHLGFAMFLAMMPVIFIKSIVFFSGETQLDSLLILLMPLAIVGACAHFIQCVLTDLVGPKNT